MSNLQLSLKKTPSKSKLPSNKAMGNQKSIISTIDKSLKHLNQISQANIVAQELYIQLLKQKKTMKFDQIKKIYLTLTESKAKQILFERDKQELIKTDYHNHQGLVRLCWRSIQKLIKKITYYMVNENNLSPISKSTLNLIQFHQQFVRRFQKVKNSSMLFVIQMMEKLIKQNSILEKKIYDILLNRGYVVSLDQFYKLNGYDAEHRDAYEAKLQTDIQQKFLQHQEKSPQIKTQFSFVQNFKKPFGRKKKIFKFDNRYSWKQNLIIQDQQNKKSFPRDKTNFQIRQSFDKFIGDFLENQNLKKIIINYQNQQNPQKKRKNSQERRKKQFLNQEGLIQKKIFQSKIEPVIMQLKTSNVKINFKILEIINDSSTEAINSKLNENDRRLSERKNSYKRQSSITGHKKIRESYSINDRKLVNQNLYRELLKRNKEIQNFLSQEVEKDANKAKIQLDVVVDCAKNSDDFRLVQHSIKQHNQNSKSDLKKQSKFSNSLKNKTSMLKSPTISQKRNSSTVIIKNKFNFLQNRFHQINFKNQQKEIQQVEGDKSLTEKIRIAKEDWQLKNQHDIFEALQNAQIDPLNPFNLTQILQILDNQNASKRDTFQNQLFHQRATTCNEHQRTKFYRIKTENGQRKRNNPRIRDMNNDFKPFSQRNFQKYNQKKVRTQNSPQKITSANLFQIPKSDNKIYEVFDRKMRRIIRH